MPPTPTDPDIVFYHDHLSPETISAAELDAWLALGGYRMHQDVFTASHVTLDRIYRLYWLRYDVRSLCPHRSHRRLHRRNNSFACTITPLAGIDAAHHELHQKYRASIDFDGAPTIANCLFGDRPDHDNIFQTYCLSVYDGDRLIAGGFFDLGETSAASILHYFDPDYRRHSLGKFLILLTIEYLQASGRIWYYPGYVVQGHPKMDYKLFLGDEQAQYFDPGTSRWKPFSRELLVGEQENIEILVLRWLAEAVQTGRFPSHPLLAEFGDDRDTATMLRECPRLIRA
jgi:leucyl-tRNA---protein transferase